MQSKPRGPTCHIRFHPSLAAFLRFRFHTKQLDGNDESGYTASDVLQELLGQSAHCISDEQRKVRMSSAVRAGDYSRAKMIHGLSKC